MTENSNHTTDAPERDYKADKVRLMSVDDNEFCQIKLSRLKYQSFTPSGYKDIGIGKFDFVSGFLGLFRISLT